MKKSKLKSGQMFLLKPDMTDEQLVEIFKKMGFPDESELPDAKRRRVKRRGGKAKVRHRTGRR